MDDIKLFDKNQKELETLIQVVRIYSQDIGMEYGIDKYAMQIMKSGKKEMMKVMEVSNQEKSERSEKRKLTNTWDYRKRTPENMWIWKKKLKDNTSGERGNYSKLNYIVEISYLDRPPRKILGAILKMNERRTSTNGSENKKIHCNA